MLCLPFQSKGLNMMYEGKKVSKKRYLNPRNSIYLKISQ